MELISSSSSSDSSSSDEYDEAVNNFVVTFYNLLHQFVAANQPPPPPPRRRRVRGVRHRQEAQERLMRDYFVDNPTYNPRQKSVQEKWAPKEQMALARLSVSEDPAIGNYQATSMRRSRGRSIAKGSKSNSSSPSGWSSGSDARVHIDLNETDEVDTQETRVHRVVGRDAGKKAARAGSSGSLGMTQFGEEFFRMRSSLTELVDVGKKRVEQAEKKLAMKARKQHADDMRQLLIDPATVPEVNRRTFEEIQRQIRERCES